MKPPILVTGAAGFIGYHLTNALLAAGEAVVGFDNLNDYYDVGLKQSRLQNLAQSAGFTFIKGDLADEEALRGVMEAHRPAIIVNLAAQAGVRYSIDHPRAYLNSNMIGFFNVLEAARAHGVKHLVYASSSSVYGDDSTPPYAVTERADRPVSLYAATKRSNELMAYAYAHLYEIPCTGLRFFTVYGPYGRPDMAYFKFFKSILDGKTIDVYNHGDMERDFTFVDDVADCVLRILPAPPKPDENGDRYALYNIGNNHPERLERFIEVLEDAAGRRAVKRYLPMQAGDVHMTAADIAETARDFGFCPKTGIEQGLRIFADWYRAYYGVSSTNE